MSCCQIGSLALEAATPNCSRISVKKSSAAGVNIWYFFQIKNSFVSSVGVRGRKHSILRSLTSTSFSKVSTYPTPSRARMLPLKVRLMVALTFSRSIFSPKSFGISSRSPCRETISGRSRRSSIQIFSYSANGASFRMTTPQVSAPGNSR